jgi:hypothetical protein
MRATRFWSHKADYEVDIVGEKSHRVNNNLQLFF